MVQPKNRRLVTESALELFINTQAASPVVTLAELPPANSGNMGLIRFVASENEPYYSNGATWSSIAQGAQGVPGPAGAGVPSGGEPLQIIRKNSVGTTTEWATLTKSLVGLSNVDNTSDMNKPVSGPQAAALGAEIAAAKTDAIEDASTKYGGLPSRVAVTEARTESISPAEDDGFRVRDVRGSVALEVLPDGSTGFAGAKHRASDVPYRVVDAHGRVALEVDSQGRTHIYDQATGGGGGTSPEVTTLHVFVCSGQSNMQGRGFPIEGPQTPRIMQFGATRRILEQAPLQLDMVPGTAAGTSPALFFAENYLATQPDHVGVLLIPAAMGGTKFTWTETSDDYTWTNGTAINPEHGLYERSVQQALDGIAAARAAGYHVITKGVLWHQGEGNGGVATATYAQALDTLISDYRTDLGHSTLPVMIGQQCPEGMEDNPAKYTVDAAHQDTPYRTSFTGFAPSTRDGHNVGDTTHFSTVGTKHLGDTYNTAYIQALGNTRPIGA